MRPNFIRDMLFLLAVALSCFGLPLSVPLMLFAAIAVARWDWDSASVPWSCMFCGSKGLSAFVAWAIYRSRKLHWCKK